METESNNASPDSIIPAFLSHAKGIAESASSHAAGVKPLSRSGTKFRLELNNTCGVNRLGLAGEVEGSHENQVRHPFQLGSR